jgi:hypothetical protein
VLLLQPQLQLLLLLAQLRRPTLRAAAVYQKHQALLVPLLVAKQALV